MILIMSQENLGKEVNMSLRQHFERNFISLLKKMRGAKNIPPQEFRRLLEEKMPEEILVEFGRNYDEGASAYLYIESEGKMVKTDDYYPRTDMEGLIRSSQEDLSVSLRGMPYRHVRKEGSPFSWFLRETNS